MDIRKRSIELIKNNPKFWMFFLFCFGMFGVQSCKKDPPCNDPSNSKCPNYDPCYLEKKVTAGFKIYAVSPYDEYYLESGWYEPYYLSDTVVRTAKFVSNIDDAEYEWHIGANTYNTKEVTLEFLSANAGEQIPITLIVNKKPNNACHLYDNVTDTQTRNITITQSLLNYYFPYSPQLGETWVFEAQDLDVPTKKWQFEYSYLLDDSVWLYKRKYFNNIPKGFEMKKAYTDLRGGIVGVNFLVGHYIQPIDSLSVMIGMYYVDGEYYDFKLKWYNYFTEDGSNSPIYKFRARRIQ